MKNLKRISFIIIAAIISTTFQGCFDKVEIDRKTFVSGIGVDVCDENREDTQMAAVESLLLDKNDRTKMKVSYSLPNLGLNSEGKGAQEESTISMNVYSFADALAQGNLKSSRSINSGHVKMILLSCEILKYPETIKDMVDYIDRHPLFNRTILMGCCEGNAEDYINFKPKTEKSVENYIKGLIQNSESNYGIFGVNLNEFLSSISMDGNAIIPRMKLDPEKQEILLDGAAIIKDYKGIGKFNKEQTSYLEMLKGKLKGGKRVLVYKNHAIDFFIEHTKRRIKVEELNGRINFDINVIVEGTIKGYDVSSDLFQDSELSKIEQNFDQLLENQCKKVIDLSQKEYGVDFVGLIEYVRKFKPSLWDKIEENIEEVYKDAVININVNTKIRRIGVTR